jgi:hypothetical protein
MGEIIIPYTLHIFLNNEEIEEIRIEHPFKIEITE